ncbi:MAG: O-antigen ligase family protein [Planctomycetota bacterium]
MKHFALLMCMSMAGGILGLASPFWPLLLYYVIAVLQPAVLWDWSLAGWPEVRWGAVSAALLVISCVIHGQSLMREARLNPILVLCAMFGVWVTVSALAAFSVDVAHAWGVELGKVLLVVAMGSLIIRRIWQIRLLSMAVAACVGYVALSIHQQYFFEGGRLDVYHHGLLNLDNNGVGLILVVAMPLAYYAAFHRAELGPRVGLALRGAGFAGFGLMLHAVMMTYSRGAMLAAAATCAFLTLGHRPRRHALGLVIVGVAAVLFLAGPDIRERAVSSVQIETDSSAQSRLASWEAAWEMTWANPLLGAGMRNSTKFSQNFGADLPGRVIHNQYLQVAADSGIPAAMLYLAMVALSWVRLRRCATDAAYAADRAFDAGDLRAEARALDAERLCHALSASVVGLAVSAMFLSIEIVELPWMLLMLAGVAPMAVHHHLSGADRAEPQPVSWPNPIPDAASDPNSVGPAPTQHTPGAPHAPGTPNTGLPHGGLPGGAIALHTTRPAPGGLS